MYQVTYLNCGKIIIISQQIWIQNQPEALQSHSFAALDLRPYFWIRWQATSKLDQKLLQGLGSSFYCALHTLRLSADAEEAPVEYLDLVWPTFLRYHEIWQPCPFFRNLEIIEKSIIE